MITNQRQYAITKAQLERFGQALADQRSAGPGEGVHPRIHQAMLEGYESQMQELQDELGRYEDLRSGRVAERTLDSLRDLPVALIEARIVARLSQRALAELLSVPEQQVQRWEATRYAGVSVDRLQDVADALGIRMSETIAYAIPSQGNDPRAGGGLLPDSLSSREAPTRRGVGTTRGRVGRKRR